MLVSAALAIGAFGPLHLVTTFGALGLAAAGLWVFALGLGLLAWQVMTLLAERVSKRVRVRPVRRAQLAEDAAIMREIFNDAWEHNWGFVPLDAGDWLLCAAVAFAIVLARETGKAGWRFVDRRAAAAGLASPAR